MLRFWVQAGVAAEGAGLAEGTFGGGATRNRYSGFNKGGYTPVGRNIGKLEVTVDNIGDGGYGYMKMEVMSKGTGKKLQMHGLTNLKGKDLEITLTMEGRGGLDLSDHGWKNTSLREVLQSRSDLVDWGKANGYESITITYIRDYDSSSANPGKTNTIKIY